MGKDEKSSCGYTADCDQCYDAASKDCRVYYDGVFQYVGNFPCHWTGFAC
jgi:hypothetical protein